MKLILLLLFAIVSNNLLVAQNGLPAFPDPNKCYVRGITPNEFVDYEIEVFTYTEEEALLYPCELREVEVVPAHSRWEYTKVSNSLSADDNNTQVLCFRKYPATYEEYYFPIDSTLGNPKWEIRVGSELFKVGGISRFYEVDCDLLEYNIVPNEFEKGDSILSESVEYSLYDYIIYAILEFPEVEVELKVHVHEGDDSVDNLLLSELRAVIIEEYLIESGHHPEKIFVEGVGDSEPYHTCRFQTRCTHKEKQKNTRIEWKINGEKL